MEVPIDKVLKRIRRRGIEIGSVRKGRGTASEQWTLPGGAILNSFSELAEFACGVGCLTPGDVITTRQLRPDERAEAKERAKAEEAQRVIPAPREDAAQCSERFAEVLTGLVFDLSYEGQSDIWREALRVAPMLADTASYHRWRTKHADRTAIEFLGL